MAARPRNEWNPTPGWRLSTLLRYLTHPHPGRGRIYLVVSGLWFAVLVYLGFATDWLDRFFQSWFWPIYIATATVSVASLVYAMVRSRRGSSTLSALASERGLQFSSHRRWPMLTPLVPATRPNSTLAHRWNWEPFDAGEWRVYDVLAGEFDGHEFIAFTYENTARDSGQCGVITVRLPKALPRLQVVPESLVGAVAPGLLRLDVDLENDAFNRRFRVSCDDRKYAVDVLNPRAVEALLSAPPFWWRIDGADLMALGAAFPDAAEVVQKLGVLTAVADHIPSFVYREHGVEPVEPVEPVQPVQPVQPVEPVEPVRGRTLKVPVSVQRSLVGRGRRRRR